MEDPAFRAPFSNRIHSIGPLPHQLSHQAKSKRFFCKLHKICHEVYGYLHLWQDRNGVVQNSKRFRDFQSTNVYCQDYSMPVPRPLYHRAPVQYSMATGKSRNNVYVLPTARSPNSMASVNVRLKRNNIHINRIQVKRCCLSKLLVMFSCFLKLAEEDV